MTQTCEEKGCQMDIEGVCPEHQVEVERRKDMQKVVLEMQETVKHFTEHSQHMRRSTKRLTKMFWITLTSFTLLCSGLGIAYYLIAHLDQASRDRYEMGMADLEVAIQQSIDRDHLIVQDIKVDRNLQLELVKATSMATAEMKDVVRRLEKIEK